MDSSDFPPPKNDDNKREGKYDEDLPEQQMESDIPANLVQGVVLEAGARLGTLLRPKYPTARQRAQ